MDHVIWTGQGILKYLFTFVLFWIEKKDEFLCNFCHEITQHFLEAGSQHFRTQYAEAGPEEKVKYKKKH